jgi:glycosyltransferase involved in cell wall biosynthesis
LNIDYELVVFSDDWDGLPCSCRHLVKHFIPDIPVIWVDTIGLRSPQLTLYDIRRSIQKILSWLSARRAGTTTNNHRNLRILNPFQVPYNHYSIVRIFNALWLAHAVNQLKHNPSITRRVVLTTWPFLGDIFGGVLKEDLSVYYRVDDFSEFPGVRRNHIQTIEEELIRKVDLVIGTAEKLSQVTQYGKIGHYLPHGVDYEHFASSQITESARLRMEAIPSPRIGFFGLLNTWIDFELIRKVASSHKDWSFVFIGPSQLPQSALPSLPNLHFIGPVPYADLPSHSRYFQVGLIPFEVTPLTIVVNPMKLLEYFALGIPVVSTPLPEVIKHKDLVYIAGTPDEFASAIDKALRERAPDLRQSRLDLAMSHSWASKAQELRTWIEQALK